MKAIKKAIVLGFRFAVGVEVVKTIEGSVTAQAGDAVLTGTKGECWPIPRPKFEATYDFDEAAGNCAKKAIVVDAEEMSAPFEVVVGWSAEPLQGKAGDYRLTYGPGDYGVVAREIFHETYDVVG